MDQTSYRGYTLMGRDDIGILIIYNFTQEIVDSAPNLQTAKNLVDSWLNAI